MNYAVVAYSSITTTAVGTFGYAQNISATNAMSPISICKEYYAQGVTDPTNYFYNFTNTQVRECLQVFNETALPGDPSWSDFSIEQYFELHNFSLEFSRLLKLTVEMPLRTIYLNSLDRSDEPECYDVTIKIMYDNLQHDGQILIHLDSEAYKHTCNGAINNSTDYQRTHELIALNVLVITLSSISFILCLRSLIKAQQLRHETVHFFRNNFGRELDYEDKMNFVDLWIAMMMLNDILIVAGSIIKMRLERRIADPTHYGIASLILGVGNLLGESSALSICSCVQCT